MHRLAFNIFFIIATTTKRHDIWVVKHCPVVVTVVASAQLCKLYLSPTLSKFKIVVKLSIYMLIAYTKMVHS